MPEDIQSQDGVYKRIATLVDSWLENHKGETFDLDLICRQLEIRERDNRHNVVKKLSYEVNRGKLEKSNRIYRYIDNTIKYIDWVNADEKDTLDIKWPCGHEDDSEFGFAGNIVVSPGDIIVVAGQSNMGKTAFCLNFLWENMDNYPCTLMGNEYVGTKFKRRVNRMTWNDPMNGNGSPKFELIERRDNWKDIIRPDNINIVDWINLGDNFYQIGVIIDGIQSKLCNGTGIALLSIQKSAGKSLGLGGGFSEHLASVYLSIDYELLTVIKCKEWHTKNPNNQVYGFSIVDGGTKFHNIREMKKCPKCWGKGYTTQGKCDECEGKGWVDK